MHDKRVNYNQQTTSNAGLTWQPVCIILNSSPAWTATGQIMTLHDSMLSVPAVPAVMSMVPGQVNDH